MKRLIRYLPLIFLLSCTVDKCVLMVQGVDGSPQRVEPAYDCTCYRGECRWRGPGGARQSAKGFIIEVNNR